MPSRLPRLLRTLVALPIGVFLGYFVLQSPIINFPVEDIQWLVPHLKSIDNYFYNMGAHYVVVAVLLSILAIPNVLLIAVIVAFSMKLIGRPRSVFYSTLVWPALIYLSYWIEVLRLKARAVMAGLPSDIDHLPTNVYFPARAVGMLLIYSLYVVVVILVYRRLSLTRKNPSLNADAPASGGGPDS